MNLNAQHYSISIIAVPGKRTSRKDQTKSFVNHVYIYILIASGHMMCTLCDFIGIAYIW